RVHRLEHLASTSRDLLICNLFSEVFEGEWRNAVQWDRGVMCTAVPYAVSSTAAPDAISLSGSVTPQASRTDRVSRPGEPAGRTADGWVRENRGAGAPCTTPSTSRYTSRAMLCGSWGASSRDNTGAPHASTLSKTFVHSSRVRSAKRFAKASRITGQFARSVRSGSPVS